MKYTKHILSIVFISNVFLCFGQDNKTIEKDLFDSYVRLTNCSSAKYDSTLIYDSIFENKLLIYTNKYPATIMRPFKSLAKYFYHPPNIITSSDGFFRIYSWDNMSGGTMRFNDNVFQYRAEDKVKSCLLKNLDTTSEIKFLCDNYTNIFTLKTKDDTYYLTQFYDRGSSRDRIEGIEIFAIKKDSIVRPQIIKMDSSTENAIGFAYDLFANNAQHTIYFKGESIYLPITKVDTSESEAITKKYIKYHFDGQYFVKEK